MYNVYWLCGSHCRDKKHQNDSIVTYVHVPLNFMPVSDMGNKELLLLFGDQAVETGMK